MMQKQLEQYRKLCKCRHIIGFIIEVLISWVLIAHLFVNLPVMMGGEAFEEVHNPVGIVYVILALAGILKMRQNPKVLKDDAALKAAYLEEHDERNIAIRAKAGQPVVQYLSLAMLMGGAVLDFINLKVLYPVSMTMELTGCVQLLVSWSLKKYWEKRM